MVWRVIRSTSSRANLVLCVGEVERSEQREKRKVEMGRSTIRGNIGSFFGNALGGVRGRQNAAAWVVACTAAYFLWIKPERDAQREEEARAILRREADLHRYVQKTRPVADPQARGLIIGKPKVSASDS